MNFESKRSSSEMMAPILLGTQATSTFSASLNVYFLPYGNKVADQPPALSPSCCREKVTANSMTRVLAKPDHQPSCQIFYRKLTKQLFPKFLSYFGKICAAICHLKCMIQWHNHIHDVVQTSRLPLKISTYLMKNL